MVHRLDIREEQKSTIELKIFWIKQKMKYERTNVEIFWVRSQKNSERMWVIELYSYLLSSQAIKWTNFFKPQHLITIYFPASQHNFTKKTIQTLNAAAKSKNCCDFIYKNLGSTTPSAIEFLAISSNLKMIMCEVKIQNKSKTLKNKLI